MAKSWYSYTSTSTTAPSRNHTSNYTLVSTLPVGCGASIVRPCAIFSNSDLINHPAPDGGTGLISTNLQNYLNEAVGSAVKWPVGTGSIPFVYLKS